MNKSNKVIKQNEYYIYELLCNEKFELLDESYSVSDIQYYFEYIIKKHQKLIDNSPIKINVN